MNEMDPIGSNINKMEEAILEATDQKLVALVREAKSVPLPKMTKILGVLMTFALIFTSGIWVGHKKATSTSSLSSGSLSLSGLGGASGGFSGGRNFQGFRNRNSSASFGASTAGAEAITSTDVPSTTSVTVNLPDDVAGTVVSMTSKAIIIEKLDGTKATYPISDLTKYRTSSTIASKAIKAGDIVTLKPDTDKSAKTITVVK